MTAGKGNWRNTEGVVQPNEVICQLQEISGASYEQVKSAYLTCNGDVKKALSMLTKNESKQSLTSSATQVNSKEVIEINDDKDDDLAKAIQLSLQESSGGFCTSISEEDKEISKVLEASLIESRGGNKRKRGNIWQSFIDPENPHERKRKEGLPVGLKNVGNTCWFSAVIQALFHIPKFRKLVLNCKVPEDNSVIKIKDNPKLLFLVELQRLFALLLGSNRKYVNPSKTIEIFEDAVRGNGKEVSGDQQDVSEFTHALLDWLEEAFTSESLKLQGNNHIADLFYGRTIVDSNSDGERNENEEIFGAIPLHVRGNENIYDSLDDAMIRVNTCDSSSDSIQEHWFTHLPVILTFNLSRFIFNQHLSRTEKIHDHFQIDQIIYLARYMKYNGEITREKRKTVNGLRKKKKELHDKLERYTSFGSKSKKKAPITTTLDSTMEFIEMETMVESEDEGDIAMSISPDNSPNSKRISDEKDYERLIMKAEEVQGPSPKDITDDERNVMINCLKRWRNQVEEEACTLKKAAEFVENKVRHAYDEECMKEVPYRLHAILIHEGQANGGHYWSYVFNKHEEKWYKYNDMTVSEATWDEILRESNGGYRNTCAYCLFYVDARKGNLFQLAGDEEHLPEYINKYVYEDNELFKKEVQQWDAKCKETRQNTTTEKEQNQNKQTEEILAEEIKRLTNSNWKEGLPFSDKRLKNKTLYYLASDAPIHVVNRSLCEELIQNHNEHISRLVSIQDLKSKLKTVEENPEHVIVYKIWREYLELFLKANTCFVLGAEAFYAKRFSESLPYLMHSAFCNEQLIKAEHKPAFMDRKLTLLFRRKCLQILNDEACQLFESEDKIRFEEGYDLIKEQILPSLTHLTESSEHADFSTVDCIREKWFSFVGQANISDRHAKMLEDILTIMIDEPSKKELKYQNISVKINNVELFERYTKIIKQLNYSSYS